MKSASLLTLLIILLQPYGLKAENSTLWPNKVKVGGEFRIRLESEINFDGPSTQPVQDTFVLLRTRVYLDLNPTETVRLFAMFQDSETLHQGSALFKTPTEHNFYQGFVSFKSQGRLSARLKMGRQELKYGDERLIGALDWSNLGRSFDGAVLRLETRAFWLDLFGTRIKASGKELQFAGAYGHWNWFLSGEFEPYVLVLHGNASGLNGNELSLVTIGARITGTLKKKLDYGFEGAYQTGTSGRDRVSAYALHLRTGYTFDLPWKPRIGMEYNFASGDPDPGNGTVRTFNNLFPTNHNKYGYIDYFSWKNIHNFRFSFSSAPMHFMMASLDYHLFFLPEPNDGIFSASGAQLRAGSPGASHFAGQELDLLLKFKASSFMDAMVGYSIFFPGPFFKDTGASSVSHFIYSQLTFHY